MLAAIVPAAFQHIEEALHVGIDIGVRIVQRMAHAGLRREMDDMREFVLGEQLRGAVAIGKIVPDEAEMVRFFELGDARFFQLRIVIRRHAVDADDVAAFGEQTPRDMRADKARRAGDENAARSSQPPQFDAAGLGLAVEHRFDVEHEPLPVLAACASSAASRL